MTAREVTCRDYAAMLVEGIERGVWKRPEGAIYAGRDEVLTRHGRLFEWAPGTVPADVGEAAPGMCYREAGMLATTEPERFTYCEGYACDVGGMPVAHAWVVDREGRVIDPTWEGFVEERGTEEREYFGVAISYERVYAAMIRTQTWGVLTGNWPELFEREWEEVSV